MADIYTLAWRYRDVAGTMRYRALNNEPHVTDAWRELRAIETELIAARHYVLLETLIKERMLDTEALRARRDVDLIISSFKD